MVPDFRAWHPDDWAALGAMLTAGIAVSAAVVALFQVGEARRLREEQSRPFVVVDIQGALAWRNLLEVVIENPSSTVAKDVRVTFEPPLQSSDPTSPVPESLLIRGGIRTLPPGRSIRAYFDKSHERINTDLPMRYDVTVRYKDFRDREQEPITYTIELKPLYGITQVNEYGIHDAAKALQEIQKLLKQHVSPLSRMAREVAARSESDLVRPLDEEPTA